MSSLARSPAVFGFALVLLGLGLLGRPPAARAVAEPPNLPKPDMIKPDLPHPEDLPPAPAPADPQQVGGVLIRALQDENALVRKRAAIALGRLGPAAAVAVPELKKALQDRDPAVRAAAAAALEKIDVPASLETVLARVRDRKARMSVRTAACWELAERFAEEPEATAALEEMLIDPDLKVTAAQALEKIDSRPQPRGGSVSPVGDVPPLPDPLLVPPSAPPDPPNHPDPATP